MSKIFKTFSPRTKSVILILITIFLFSMMDAVAKILVQTYPSDQVIWARYMSQTIVSIIVLFPIEFFNLYFFVLNTSDGLRIILSNILLSFPLSFSILIVI